MAVQCWYGPEGGDRMILNLEASSAEEPKGLVNQIEAQELSYGNGRGCTREAAGTTRAGETTVADTFARR